MKTMRLALWITVACLVMQAAIVSPAQTSGVGLRISTSGSAQAALVSAATAGAQLPAQAYFTRQRWATKQGTLFSDMLWFVGDFNGDGKQDMAVVWNDGGLISIDMHRSTGSAFTLERWETRQGAALTGMLWFVGDFNGDGKDDLAVQWNDVGMISIDVHVSTGSTFTRQRWATQQGAVFAGMLWFAGDFGGDGKRELAVVWNDGGLISIDVHASTGAAFTLQRWETMQGALLTGMLWLAGDFNGDGKDDLAVEWNDLGGISIDVHASTGRAFTRQRWATQQGAVLDNMRWFAGDFDGDGKDDLGAEWPDAGGISIDVHASTGTAFALQRWATRQGAVLEGMLWFSGDFNGDGKDDVAVEFSDAGKISIDVHASTGTAFVLQRWATRSGDTIGSMLWFVADCNGDGTDDLVNRWNEAGMISMDVFVANVRYAAYLPFATR